MMPLIIKEMHLLREDENLVSIDLNIYQFINWTEHSSIIKWLEYQSIFQVTWTRTMLSSVLFWVLQVKTKLPIDLPLNDKDFNFYVDFFLLQLCLLTHGQVNLWGLVRNRQWTAITPFDYYLIIINHRINYHPECSNLSSSFLMRSRYLRTRKCTRQMTILDEDSICAIHCSRSTQRSHIMVICRLIDFDLRER